MAKKKAEDKKLAGWKKAGIVAGIIGIIAESRTVNFTPSEGGRKAFN
jgi:hypothetical protein